MNEKLEKVSYKEALSIRVGNWIRQKGFELSSRDGTILDSLTEIPQFGILQNDPDTKLRRGLFGLIRRKPRRRFLGVIWFSNSERCADEKNWVFDVYGREYVQVAIQLTKEMALIFNVNILVHLVREQPDTETYMSDYDL